MNCKNGITTCQGSNSRLLGKAFKTKLIKEEDKTSNQHLKAIQVTEKSEQYLTNLQLLLPLLIYMSLALSVTWILS